MRELYVFDTSFLQPLGDTINKSRKRNFDGSKIISPDELEEAEERILGLNNLLDEGSLVVPPEARQETEVYLKSLKGSIREGKAMKRTTEVPEIRKNKELEKARSYQESLSGLHVRFLNNEPKHFFTEGQMKSYRPLVNYVIKRSRDITKSAAQKTTMNNPRYSESLGQELKTDQKVVAIGLILALENNTTILTNDLGIVKLTQRLRPSSPKIVQDHLHVYAPNLENSERKGSAAYRVARV